MKTNLDNYEERFVDYMEGQLSPSEMREVETFVAQHPELEEDFKLFGISKLKPDTTVTYGKKETLIQASKTVVIPLFAKIAAMAAAIALLIVVGIRHLHPTERLPLPMTASLNSIKAKPIATMPEEVPLKKSGITIQKRHSFKPQELPTTRPNIEKPTPARTTAEMTLALQPIQKPLEQSVIVEYDKPEDLMIKELDLRIAALEPIKDPLDELDTPMDEYEGEVVASLGDFLFDNAVKLSKTIYKQTAKTVMTAYYTADDYFSQSARRKDE